MCVFLLVVMYCKYFYLVAVELSMWSLVFIKQVTMYEICDFLFY